VRSYRAIERGVFGGKRPARRTFAQVFLKFETSDHVQLAINVSVDQAVEFLTIHALFGVTCHF
jgi:hypothetical protein